MQDSDCNPNTTVHVDSFLYDEDDIDELVEQGAMSRNYCRACGSHLTAPLSKLYFLFFGLKIGIAKGKFLALLRDGSD